MVNQNTGSMSRFKPELRTSVREPQTEWGSHMLNSAIMMKDEIDTKSIKGRHQMFLKLYLIALPVFLAMDMLWLGLLAKDFYAKQIGFLMRPAVNWPPAIIFYLLFIVGLVLFVVMPALDKKSWIDAFFFGALFGLISYATYDLSNLATLKGWPLKVVVVDLAWGAFLSASVSVVTFTIARKTGS